jgi:hypothetical protein
VEQVKKEVFARHFYEEEDERDWQRELEVLFLECLRALDGS